MNTNKTKWFDSVDPSTIDNLPISSYFAETEKKIKGVWSFQKWLESIDKDTLTMLERYMNNFDPQYEINEEEWEDLMAFVALAVGKEGIFDEDDSEEFMVDKVQDNIPNVFGMVVMEGLRRKGAIEVKGDGLLSSGNVRYHLTETGRAIQEEIRKENAAKNNTVINDLIGALLPCQKN